LVTWSYNLKRFRTLGYTSNPYSSLKEYSVLLQSQIVKER